MSYAIAAGHDATADTAEEILKNGGNAFDAAIAAFMTSFVAEPCMASGGGGAFANVRKADGSFQLFDFFCQTPKKKRPVEEVEFVPIEVDFGTTTEIFYIGTGSVGVPGSIAGIFAMHQRLGSMPMSDLVQLPIQYAKDGVAINDFQEFDILLLQEILGKSEGGRSLFYKDGEVKRLGSVVKMEGLADFLEYMAREGQDAFYKGEVARKILSDQQSSGFLTQKDFDDYEVIIRNPLRIPYKDKLIYTNPLPSTGGSIMAHQLKYLEGLQLSELARNEKHLLQLYDSFKVVEQLNKRPEALGLSLAHLLNKKHGSTTHFNIVDKWGNAISLTSTIGEGNGSFVEGTDIQLNNMLGEAVLLPDGYHSWIPDSRLSSMMSPTIVTDANGQLEVVTGTGGASRIPGAVAQVLHYLIDYGYSVDESVNSPRAHLGNKVFNIEPGFDHRLHPNSFEIDLKLWKGQSLFFGGVHTILNRNNSLYASGDERRDGVIRVS